MDNETITFENMTTTMKSSAGSLTSSSSLADKAMEMFYISLSLIYIPGIFTNIVCLVILIIESKRSKVVTNVLLLFLCATDLIAVSLSCFWHISSRLGMPMTFELCALKSFLHPLMPLLTGGISLLMATDRAMSFCTPFFYRTNVTKKIWSVAFVILLVILSAVCVLPHFGLSSMWTLSARRGKMSYICSVYTYQTDPVKRIYHTLYVAIGFGLILGIIVCNVLVVGAVLMLRRRTMVTSRSHSNQSAVKRSLELKFAAIVGLLSCVFITCWLPYNVWLLYKLLDIPMDYEVVTKIHLLGGFNYSTDPFVYLIIRRSNRAFLAKLFCCLGMRGGKQIGKQNEKEEISGSSNNKSSFTIQSSLSKTTNGP